MLKKIFCLVFIVFIIFSCNAKKGLTEKELNLNLLKAIESGKIQKVKKAIDSGANLNFSNYSMDNPLAKALFGKKWEIADLLIERGADANHKLVLACKVPIIMLAVYTDRPDVVKYLISKGANVNEKSEKGANAILLAACQNKIESAKILLDNKADINIVDDLGKTALTMATIRVNKEMVDLLIKSGADINQIGYDKKTALELAKLKNNKEIISMLEKASNKL